MAPPTYALSAVFQFIIGLLLLRINKGQECFEQQYSNAVADLRSAHIIQRLAVVAPQGAFYVQPAIDIAAADAQFHDGDASAFIRRDNGEPLAVYASTSFASPEWQSLNLLASAIRIVSAFNVKNAQTHVSPILLITACPYKSRIIYLDAKPFTVSSAAAGLASMYENELIVDFRTFEDGIFLFSMADQGDLLVAQLNAGRVETFFDLGALSRSSLSGGRALNDGAWHEMRWTHHFDAVQLFVDKMLVNSTAPSGLYRKLDFNHQIDVGGRPEDQYSGDILSNFHGCLARVQLNNVDLLQFAPESTRQCQMAQPQTLSIGDEGAVRIAYSFLPFSLEFRILQRPAALLAVLNEVNETLLDVRVDDSRQLVLEADNRQIQQTSLPAVTVNDGSWHTLSVKLRGGRLDIEVDAQTVLWLEGALVRRIGVHMAAFRLAAAGCYRSTTVDLRSSVTVTPESVHKDNCLYQERCLPNPCKNGGSCIQSSLNAFRCECPKFYVGTYCHISILPRSCEDYRNRRRLAPSAKSSTSAALSSAVATALTSNGGGSERTSALLKSLQQFSLPSNANSDIVDDVGYVAAHGADGERVVIDLDGGGPLRPFVVYCLTSNTTGKAGKRYSSRARPTDLPIINGAKSTSDESSAMAEPNDEESVSEATPTSVVEELDDEGDEVTQLYSDLGPGGVLVADGPTEPGAIRRTLNYGVTGIELDRFVDGFDSCRQHMHFECRGGTRLMSYGTERRPSTWYASRGDQHGLQWADAPPYSRMCACALNATCEGNKLCNCDSGRDSIDQGYNRFQQLLPVLQVFVGGTTAVRKSSARVNIGPLRCVRRKVFGAVTFASRNAQLVGAQTFDSPVFDFYVQLRYAHEHMTVFTWESTNEHRWFQLLTRGGRIVGQLVNAGQVQEIVTDVPANDGAWHTVHWTIDRYAMQLAVDRHEKTLNAFFLLPATFNYIIGSRTTRGNGGFAGQLRSLYLAGEEIQLQQLTEKLHPSGIHIGEAGFCDQGAGTLRRAGSGSLHCFNGGICVEMFDRFKCNCSATPFAGDRCDQEVGVWVPAGSQLSIPWQHLSQTASTCHAISVYTQSVDVALVRARALFAESSFNISINEAGHLNVQMYDGFFFTHNVTFEKFALNDAKLKSVKFCATRNEFRLTLNEEPAISLDGNFTFFQHFNVWNFVNKNFTGCVSRLKVGSGFPLKSPTLSRLSYSPGVRFGRCPFDPLEYHKNDETRQFANEEDDEAERENDEIRITAIMKSRQRLLLITPAIGLLSAAVLALTLCIFVCYVRSRPDGVYKTNENLVGGYATSSSAVSSSVVSSAGGPVSGAGCGLMTGAMSHSGKPLVYGAGNGTTTYFPRQFPGCDQSSLFTKEYFC